VAEVVTACERLPLALRIAASRLAARPQWNIRHLADRLADPCRLLDELRVGGLDVRASLRLGCEALEPATARAFRLLALLNAPSTGIRVAAALLNVSAAHAEQLLENLVDVHLLVSDQPGCYGYHDQLTRAFAVEQASALESESERAQAVDRAGRAMDAYRPRILPMVYTGLAGCSSTVRF